ncbi:MAG TPA: hypothetical protein ENJ04_04395 [Nitrospirae bacterium]|nr:hypothetical protein [Nitrospirota bacterium]
MRFAVGSRSFRGLVLVALVALQSLLILSCGYRVQRTSVLPLASVRIDGVENRTFEPGLQDLFVDVMAEELLRNGIALSDSSEYVLSAVLTDYRLDTLSIKDDLSVEYIIRVVADVTLGLPGGDKREFKGVSSEFMETFVSADDIQSIQSQREVATEKAVRSLAQRVVADILNNTELDDD